MRALQLITQTRGGPVDHAVEIAVELAGLGHASHLVGPRGDHLAVAARSGVQVHIAEVHGKTDVAGARAVADVITRVRPDVLHLQDRRAGLVGRVLAVRRAIPSVYTLHGVPDELAGLVPGNVQVAASRARDRWGYLRFERVLAAAPRSVVVTPCEALTSYVREHVGVPYERVHTVPNGVAKAWLESAERMEREEDRPVRVTWLGVMQPVKRVPDLVRAAARVPDLELQLVGDGPERSRIEAAVAATGSTDRVHFAGYRADPLPNLLRSDVVVLPSAAEACPMALLQAMACGVPVIASRVGGIPEIVRDGVDGVLVDPGVEDQLVDALALLAGDPELRRRLGAAGRSRVVDRFGISRSARSLVAIYERLAA
jgi:glycosyltransferase involved in cell wall biosynthesis